MALDQARAEALALLPMANGDRWARWNVTYTTRDGLPTLSEESIWQLELLHPETVERTPDGALYLHLDQTYRVTAFPDRAFRALIPAERPRRSAG
jgi:hypothetical protein